MARNARRSRGYVASLAPKALRSLSLYGLAEAVAASRVSIIGATPGSTLSVTSGSLPSGMTLNSAARTISGTPSVAGNYSFTLTETLPGATGSPKATPLTMAVEVGSTILRVAAPGGRINTAVSASNTKGVSFVTGIAPYGLRRPRILHMNWYVPPGTLNETDGSAPLTASDWIEFDGVLYDPVTGTCGPGQELVNDMGPLVIPPGAQFKIWSLREGPNVLYGNLRSTATGGNITGAAVGALIGFGASRTGPTGPGQTIATPSAGNAYFPVVLDETDHPCVILYDDSHGYGTNDTLGLNNLYGPFERLYGLEVPWLNMSVPGDSLAKVKENGNFTRRARLAQYATDIDIGYGGNDISNGRSAVDIIADIKALRASLPADKQYFTATEFPKTTGDFTTVPGQTPSTQEGVRQAVNVFKRSGYFDYVFDFERAVSVIGGAGSGDNIVWPANGTADGTHGNAMTYAAAAAGVAQRLPA